LDINKLHIDMIFKHIFLDIYYLVSMGCWKSSVCMLSKSTRRRCTLVTRATGGEAECVKW